MPVYHYDENGKLIGKSVSAGEKVLGAIGILLLIAVLVFLGYGFFHDAVESIGAEKVARIKDILSLVLGGIACLVVILGIVGMVKWIVNLIKDGWKDSFTNLPGIFKICVAIVLSFIPLFLMAILS